MERFLHGLHDHQCKVLITIRAGRYDYFVLVGAHAHREQVAAAGRGHPGLWITRCGRQEGAQVGFNNLGSNCFIALRARCTRWLISPEYCTLRAGSKLVFTGMVSALNTT